MYLHTAEPKTAEQFIARLRETEKIAIRGASNPDRLEWLRQNDFAYDMMSAEEMQRAYDLLIAAFKVNSAKNGFEEATWPI